ncbi:MAG: 23S rRNA (pseudouridine(1915)-N(3))-methyltransferase RlmH [Gammaproteobacteria bacterium]|nr:MAG: 23S rRNA (pseudouridine(1915)-N(3))-methyltransferase RlmH [Gammaproteobacteria bacterium]
MQISLLAVGTRPPAWVRTGFADYQRRLPPGFRLTLEEIPARPRRRPADTERATREEGAELLRRAAGAAQIVALDERGDAWSTRELAARLAAWQQQYPKVALLVGGADGLSPDCLSRADARWSLSRLTLPHALVRVLIAEQLYRAWTLLQGHPYHRD